MRYFAITSVAPDSFSAPQMGISIMHCHTVVEPRMRTVASAVSITYSTRDRTLGQIMPMVANQ